MMTIPLFPLRLNDIPKQILNKKIQSECCFIVQQKVQNQQLNHEQQNEQNNKKQDEQNHEQNHEQQDEQQVFQKYPIHLAIIDEYVVQLTTVTRQIISAFKCDFQIKFKVIKPSRNIPQEPKKPLPDYRPYLGISFQFPYSLYSSQLQQNNKTSLALYLDNDNLSIQSKKLKGFCQILQKKYITQKQFHDRFVFSKENYKGHFSCVYAAFCRVNVEKVAVKGFKKEEYFSQTKGKQSFLKQFKLLSSVHCKYIIPFYGVYQSSNSLYIITQLFQHTLYSYIKKYNFPKNPLFTQILYKLLIGLRYLHKKGIMHRDLKLENIMLRGDGKDDVQPVIIDLGFAEYEKCNEPVLVSCGTPGYVADQVINIPDNVTILTYGKQCDIFSMGAVFHIMLLGVPVFGQSLDIKIIREKNKKYQFDQQLTNVAIRPQLKQLLTKMLKKQPSKRYTVEQLMELPVFQAEKIKFKEEVQKMDREIELGII